MKSECEEKECTSVSPKHPRVKRRRWHQIRRWLLLIATVVIVILILIKPIVLPHLVDYFGSMMETIYRGIEYTITILATAASLYSVDLALEGGEDMKDVFEELGSLDENIFGRLEALDENVLARLEKVDKDVFDQLDRLDKTVLDRLKKLDGDVSAKLDEMSGELFSIHEDIRMLGQEEQVEDMDVPHKSDNFSYADEIDDSKRKDE